MEKNYGMLKRLLFIVAAIAIANVTFAQQRDITGQVTDAGDGQPIPGVNVRVKGSTAGTITDLDGNFTIQAADDNVLVFSYIGYTTQEQPVGSASNLDIKLKASDVGLDEVVVIGYGTVKKGDATGSVTAISSDDFNQGAITSPQELLMGKASGVVISAPTGAAGSGSQIRIRGGSSMSASNDPLFVIDGIPIDNSDLGGSSNPLSTINPNDIETFTVLKDASAAAIYGSRASNGVIIITTKRGKKGGVTASYNGNVSIGTPVETLEVYNGEEFRALVQDRVDNHGLTNVALDALGNANTDWQKEIYRNAISTDHNVSVSGSLKEIPYRVSIGYTNQNGMLKNDNLERITYDVSVSPSLMDDNLKIDLNVKGASTNHDFSNTGAIGSALQFDPTQPIMNGNTLYGGYTSWKETSSNDPLNGTPNNIATNNPVAELEMRDNTSKVTRLFLNGKVEYKMPFLPELKATLKGSYDQMNSNGDDLTSDLAAWSYRQPERNVLGYENIRKNSLVDFYLNFNKDLGSIHNIDVMGGYSWQHYYREGSNKNRDWEAVDGVFVNSDTTEYKNENFLVSFFGRAQYSLMDKYILTATVRYDGSSRFSEDNRWGLFPSFAAAWKINEESFLQNVSAISNLKLRVGYGVTGSQELTGAGVSNYPYIPIYVLSQQGAYYQFGNNFYPTWRPDEYDKNLKWEETTTQNIALDFGFFDERISGSIDFYQRETIDLINTIPIAAGTNFNNRLLTNVGTLENRGFEIELTARIISKEDISWELSGNLSYNKNEVTKLTLVDDPDYPGVSTGGIAGGVGNEVQINAIGYPVNTFYMFKQVYNSEGMPIEGLYVDKTGDGGVVSGNNLNKYYMQSPAPDYVIGLSSRLNYKNFDFSFSGRISIGNYVYNNNASNMGLYQSVYNQSGYTANILKDVEKTNFMTAQYWSDFYLENASFFRMDNISLGYSFDQLFTDKLRGRVSFTVQNAFTITKYSGLDPEVANGIDNNIYPRARTYMFGLNLNF